MVSNRRQSGPGTDEDRLDDLGFRLLHEVQENARISLAELGRRVGLSSPAVAERLRRLEEDGVIQAYRAQIDPRKLGFSLTAVIRIRPSPGQLRAVAELAQQTPEIAECHRITGDDCYIAAAHLRDVGHLEEVIDRFALLGQTTTAIVQSSPVSSRGLSLGW